MQCKRQKSSSLEPTGVRKLWGKITYHLPDLHNIVLRHRADDPGLVGVPGEVRDLGCVASMYELQLKKNRIQYFSCNNIKKSADMY